MKRGKRDIFGEVDERLRFWMRFNLYGIRRAVCCSDCMKGLRFCCSDGEFIEDDAEVFIFENKMQEARGSFT